MLGRSFLLYDFLFFLSFFPNLCMKIWLVLYLFFIKRLFDLFFKFKSLSSLLLIILQFIFFLLQLLLQKCFFSKIKLFIKRLMNRLVSHPLSISKRYISFFSALQYLNIFIWLNFQIFDAIFFF